MINNPPSNQPLITLSVQVSDCGKLSISENAHPQPSRVPEKVRVRQQSTVHQSSRVSSKPYTKVAPSRNRTRVSSSRRKPKNGQNAAGPQNKYRTVHFTLGPTRVLKMSWFEDGSTQVELRPLRLLGQEILPVYGCIDSRGELRLSMGGYNQNALGRMASMVVAMGLEETPDAVDQQPKRVVLMEGKTWPTFPVAVTVVEDEAPSSQFADPGAPHAVASSMPCVGEPERYQMRQIHDPRPAVQMLKVHPSPVLEPVASTSGVILATRACGSSTHEVASRSTYAPVPPGKTLVLVAENKNSSSNDLVHATFGAESRPLKLPAVDPNDTRYASTESLCSIDLPDGRLYIAEQPGNSPLPSGSIPGKTQEDKNYPPSKQIQSHEMPKGQIGHDAHQNHPAPSLQHQDTETARPAEKVNHSTFISDSVDKMPRETIEQLLYGETDTDPVEKNNLPLATSPLMETPSDVGGKSALDATAGPSSEPGADSMEEFLKYLQHLNTVMETVMAGGADKPIE